MGIDDLKARLERLLSEQGLGSSSRQQAGALHDALVDLKLGLKDLKDAVGRTERELSTEREQLATTERRARLALEINDTETADLAREYGDRHRQRVELLERKLAVQRDELTISEKEYEVLSERYRNARQGIPSSAPDPAAHPDPLEAELLKGRMDRRAVEAAADAQLEMLKRKLGKTS